MAYYDRKRNTNYNNFKPVYTGTVIQKNSYPNGSKNHFIIKYVKENGTENNICCYEKYHRFDIGDTVRFIEEPNYTKEKSVSISAKILGNYIGKVVIINGAKYIRRNERSLYTYDNSLAEEGQFVSFFVERSYDYKNNIYGKAIHVTPKDFPKFLRQGEEPTHEGIYTGVICRPQHFNQRFVEILVDEKIREANGLSHRYSYLGDDSEWIFEGDIVSFELSPERNSKGHIEATRVVKIGEAISKRNIYTLNIPKGIFSCEFCETDFSREVFSISGKVKSNVLKIISSIMDNYDVSSSLNITSPTHSKFSLLSALKNVTSSMYRQDRDYQYDMLLRFKPFYDSAVPYIYASQLGDSTTATKLESTLIDICNYLNNLF